jgi:hypothetical protein
MDLLLGVTIAADAPLQVSPFVRPRENVGNAGGGCVTAEAVRQPTWSCTPYVHNILDVHACIHMYVHIYIEASFCIVITQIAI